MYIFWLGSGKIRVFQSLFVFEKKNFLYKTNFTCKMNQLFLHELKQQKSVFTDEFRVHFKHFYVDRH